MALERGLDVVKFFPAGASGGLDFLKAIAAPYGSIRFVPTGGVDPSNLREYLSFNRVHAVGGTWIAREATISAGNFAEITQLAREAVSLSLGFEQAHVGINGENPQTATASAEMFSHLFSFSTRDGTSSIFAGTGLEFMKAPYIGTHGHLAISTLSIPRAEAYLKRKGVGVRPETAKEKDGKTIAIYLDREVAGFAIHLLQKWGRKMARFVTFGEIMLRLKPPGSERLFQSPVLEATFGGGEANVAVGLARFGCEVAYVSTVPPGAIGDACVGELRRHGIDVSRIKRKGSRLGIYFLEGGSNQRPSVVIYDRGGSSIAESGKADFD
jgi:hypothetical protein